MPPDELADEIDRLEARSANDPRTHTFARLADLYRKAGELERALEVVESGLHHHPHYLNARIVHARLLRELGRPGEAIAAFERVLRIDSQNLVAKAALAELREGRTGGASIGTEAESASRPPASGWLARLEADWNEGRAEEAPGGSAGDASFAAREPAPAGDAEAPPREPAPAAETAGGDVSAPPAERPDEAVAGETAVRAASDGKGSGDEGSATGAPPGAHETEDLERPAADAAADDAIVTPDPKPVAAHPPTPAPHPRAVIRRESGDLETATLAELYARQGLYDEAIGIFERLLARDPYNARLAASLEEARLRARGKGTAGPSNGQGDRDDAAGGAPENAGPRPDRRREAPRPGRPSDTLAAGAPVPVGGPLTADGESIRAFLARLLDGRYEPPGDGKAREDEGDLDAWLEAHGA